VGILVPRRARALGVRRRPTWRAGRDVARVPALWREQFQVTLFNSIFSADFQTQVHKSLNTKVVHQTTLYKIAKSSRMF
jgi:hypothetical protein